MCVSSGCQSWVTDWADQLIAWWTTDPTPGNDELPPVSRMDLDDTHIVTTAELDQSELRANVWNGSIDSVVTVSFDGGDPLTMTHTQPGAVAKVKDVQLVDHQLIASQTTSAGLP